MQTKTGNATPASFYIRVNRNSSVLAQPFLLDELTDHIVVYWTQTDCSDPPPGETQYFLSRDEIKKAHRISFHPSKERFMRARSFLRCIIASYLGKNPSEIIFQYGSNGKPGVKSPDPRLMLSFNISHTHKLIACAVTCNRDLGIDTEHIRPRKNLLQLSRRFFSAQEIACLQSVNPDAVTEHFFRIWTRKEAYLKATGKGLAGIEEAKEIAFSEKTGVFSDSGRQWFYKELPLPVEGYAGCIVAAGDPCPVKMIKPKAFFE